MRFIGGCCEFYDPYIARIRQVVDEQVDHGREEAHRSKEKSVALKDNASEKKKKKKEPVKKHAPIKSRL